MAIEKVVVPVEVTSNGTTQKEIKEAKALKAAYDSAEASAAKLGGTAGSRAAAARAQPSMTEQLMSGQEYRESSGVTGKAGGTARDFAKQAQGLGGLVHVYATFAANLFAVGAAFRALQDAAQTETLVKGLDQLGASSGKSLGTLAKQLADTTDGALSLRDAMTAVSQSSSAGLSNKQINDLAKVASKASQALGISMPDAVSRLSRGISKIEPELLDELGIFVRVDDAAQKYAISVGKSATSLTDFEKRQAFANAVLEQGKQKFEAIDNLANPYDKLLASVSNLATSGLELVNKVLGPIVRLLAESPTALAVVFSTIAGVLLKQAIPAISNWRTELVKSAELSAKTAKASYENFRDYSIAKALAKEQKDIEPIQQRMNESIINAQTALANTLSSKSKILSQAMSGTVDPGVMEKLVSTELARRETILKKTQEQAAADTSASEAKKAAYADILKKQEQEIINIKTAKDSYSAAAKEAAAAEKRRTSTETAAPSLWERALGTVAERQQKGATSKGILAQAGMDTQSKGVIDAFNALRDNIKNGVPVLDEYGKVVDRTTAGLKGFSAGLTLVKGSIIIASSAIATGLSVIAPYLELFGLLVSLYHVFDSAVTKTTKQQDEFNSKIQTTEAAVKTASDTLELYTVKTSKAFSVEGVLAFSNVVVGATDALFDQISAFQKLEKAADWWYKVKQGFAEYVPFVETNLDKLQKSAIESAMAIAKSVGTSTREVEFKAALGQSLQIKPEQIESVEAWNSAFDKLTSNEKRAKILEIAENAKKVKTAIESAANATKAFVDGLTEVDKLVGQVIQANQFNDLQGKLGVELVNSAHRLAEALNNPLDALAALAKLGQDPKALAALGADQTTIANLQEAVKLEDKLSKTLDARTKAQAELDLAKKGDGTLAKQARKDEGIAETRVIDVNSKVREAIAQDKANAELALREANSNLVRLKERGIEVTASLEGTISSMRSKGFEMVDISLKKAEQAAAITVEKFKATLASAAGIDTSRKETELKLQELNIQEQIIKANFDLEMATNANTDAVAALTAAQQIIAADTILSNKNATEAEKSLARSMKDSVNSFARIQSLVRGEQVAGTTAEEQGKAAMIKDRDIMAQKRYKAQIAPIEAQKQIAVLEGQVKRTEYLNKLELENLGIEKQQFSLDLNRLAIGNQLSSFASDEYLSAKKSLDLSIAEKDYQSNSKKIQDDIDKLNKNKVGYTEAEYAQKLKNLETQKTQVGYEYETKKLAIEYDSIKAKTAAKIAEATQKSSIDIQNLQTVNSLEEARINIQQKRIDTMAQMGMFNEQTIIYLKEQADLELQSLKYKEQAAKLSADVQQKELALAGAKEAQTKAAEVAKASPMNTAANLALDSANKGVATAQAQLDAAKAQQDAAKQINDLTADSIKKQAELNQRFADQKQLLSDLSNLATGLGSAFGDVGSKIGGAMSAIAEFGFKQQNAAAGIAEMGNIAKDAYEKAAKADDSEDREKYIKQGSAALKEQSRLQERADKDSLTGIGKVFGATKSMFKEKTTAYKLFATLEKTTQLASLAMELKVSAGKIAAWWGEVSAKAATEAGITAFEEMGFFERLPFYISSIYGKTIGQLGPIAGPVVATGLIAALLSMVGKGGGGHASSPTVPTSAMNQETQGTGTTWTRDASGNLVKTDTGGGVFGDNAAKVDSINKSLEIMKNGIIDGLDYDNKMLRAMERVADAITGAAQAVYAIPGLRKGGTGFGTLSGSSTDKNWYQDIPIIGGVLGSIFGGGTSVSTSIEGAGIQLKGTFEQVMLDTAGSIMQYKDVLQHFHEDGGWFGSDDDWDRRFRETAALQREVSSAIADVFGNAKEMFTNVADLAGMSTDSVTNAFKTMSASIDIDLMGLTGDEVLKELNAVIGSKLNLMAESLFGRMFDKYKKFGEGYLETVVRVVDNNEKVRKSLEYIGNTTKLVEPSVDSVTKQIKFFGYVLGTYTETIYTNSFDISEALVKAAGSLENFVDQAKYFSENFLTDQERLSVLQVNLESQLKKLGVSAKLTKQEYRALVQSQDLATVAGREMYQGLMDLAPAFIQVQELMDSVMSDAVSKLTDFVSTFKDFAKSLGQYKTSLLLGTSSILTPAEKYAEAQTVLQKTYVAALAGDRDAISAFQNVANTFLEQSKVFYASSDQYTNDFNSILTMVDSLQLSTQAQADVAQLQLTALQSHSLYLENIDKGISKLAGITPAARGGYRTGITLVGEEGPEFVDFNSPGRVYTADQTAGMFTMPRNNGQQQLIAEIADLKQEIVKLREQQRVETGHLINATYDAQNINAEAVTDGVEASLSKQAWAEKVKQSASLK